MPTMARARAGVVSQPGAEGAPSNPSPSGRGPAPGSAWPTTRRSAPSVTCRGPRVGAPTHGVRGEESEANPQAIDPCVREGRAPRRGRTRWRSQSEPGLRRGAFSEVRAGAVSSLPPTDPHPRHKAPFLPEAVCSPGISGACDWWGGCACHVVGRGQGRSASSCTCGSPNESGVDPADIHGDGKPVYLSAQPPTSDLQTHALLHGFDIHSVIWECNQNCPIRERKRMLCLELYWEVVTISGNPRSPSGALRVSQLPGALPALVASVPGRGAQLPFPGGLSLRHRSPLCQLLSASAPFYRTVRTLCQF